MTFCGKAKLQHRHQSAKPKGKRKTARQFISNKKLCQLFYDLLVPFNI